ncbi:Helix-loop-helix DNA-binding protein [Metarhizium rileyi]|uniref:Helix-loop-helix DNA-binding protein n=1 Tax=Metarhizium rileyi (strain RCEF 4871) TaxID=1649241 RepID=A0A167JH85_METRR|nr:Helix-loop-helix DNA-binding protein [Metarhizium rileyi RCEF 4871]
MKTLSFGYVDELKSSSGQLAATWPVPRTRTGSIDPDALSTHGALSLEYLGSSLHERKSPTTIGPRREKPTEQQNHILHEKKRRAMIKEGYDDLLKLVPGIKDRELSKALRVQASALAALMPPQALKRLGALLGIYSQEHEMVLRCYVTRYQGGNKSRPYRERYVEFGAICTETP